MSKRTTTTLFKYKKATLNFEQKAVAELRGNISFAALNYFFVTINTTNFL